MRKEGRKEGSKDGRKEGSKEGRKEGRKGGREEGMELNHCSLTQTIVFASLISNVTSVCLDACMHVDKCGEGGCYVTGGQTVFNPWTIIGGVASAITTNTEYIMCVHTA